MAKFRRKVWHRWALLAAVGIALLVAFFTTGDQPIPTAYAAGIGGIAGRLIDPQGEPIHGATVQLLVNDQTGSHEDHKAAPAHPAESQSDGTFVVDLPSNQVGDIQTLQLRITRPHFESHTWEASPEQIALLNADQTLRLPDLVIERSITIGFWIASITFAFILAVIALERMHNTMAALLGAAVILGASYVGGAINEGLYIFDFERALEYVDFDVIFLVMGMMIVIAVIEETGIFQWLAYQSYRLSRGRVWLLAIILMIITAIASALLDNVTTMLLMTPMTIQIALALGLNPLSLLLPEVLASNVGGISTLIGTPTNILIGSYAGLSFNDFVSNLTPGVLLAMTVLIGYVLLRYRRQYFVQGGGVSPSLLKLLRERGQITQPEKLKKAGIVFAITIAFFVVGERIHLAPAVTALLGAVAMLIWVSPDVEEMLKVVDWTTLMFFIALFILVGAIQEVGLISMIAVGISKIVGNSLTNGVLVLVWSAAFLSGVVDNIPFTAAMLPVVGFLTRTIPGAANNALFFGLSIGSAMGGNSSLIGASANLVTAGIAERAGYKITYLEFLKVGLPATVITVAAGTLWLFVHFF